MEKRLYRSRSDRMIWGVCGGIAHYFGIDPTIIRVIAILLLFAGGSGILAYIILAIVVPLESSPAREPRDVIKENVEEMKQTATQFGEDMRSTFARHQGEERSTSAGHEGDMRSTSARHQGEERSTSAGHEGEVKEMSRTGMHHGGYFIAVILIIIGVIFLLGNFFSWLSWKYLWPLILIAIGLLIIFRDRRR